MNNREIHEGVMAHAVDAPDVATGRITMQFDNFKITCNNDWRSIGAVAAQFGSRRRVHTESYLEARTASRGAVVRREPIARLIKRYPDCKEAFELL